MVGQLAAFQIMVLPQLLYMYRTVPIVVPDSYFKSLQGVVNKFVWKNQKTQCALVKLIKNRKMGGLGHVDLRDYYLASILTQLKC